MGLTNSGRNLLASLLAASLSGSSTAWLGIGTSTTAYSASQTDLLGTSFREPVDGAPGVSTNIVTYVATVGGSDANFAWEEFGLFNASSGGTMFNRLTSSQGTKGSGAVWQLTMQLTFQVG